MRRRSFLSLLSGGAIGTLAGCLSSSFGSTDTRVKREPPGAPPLGASGEWPSYRFGSGNTGYNPNGEGLREAEEYWQLDVGSVATVVDGTLYNIYGSWNYTPEPAGSADPRAEEFGSTDLVRRDPATATERSRTALHELYTGVSAPPTIARDRVFVASYVRLFCLAPDRDEILWRSSRMDGIRGPPIVQDGSVFVAALDGPVDAVGTDEDATERMPQVRSYSSETGNEQWHYDLGAEMHSPPAASGGTVYVNANDGLHAIDSETGKRRFILEHGYETIQYGTPVATTDMIYVIARKEDGNDLLAIAADSGEVRWRRPVPEFGEQTPVVADDMVYAKTSSGLVALDPADGRPSADLSGDGLPLARVGETVYAKAGRTFLALDAVDGEQLWSHETNEVRVEDVSGGGVIGVTPVTNAVYVRAADAFYGFGPPR